MPGGRSRRVSGSRQIRRRSSETPPASPAGGCRRSAHTRSPRASNRCATRPPRSPQPPSNTRSLTSVLPGHCPLPASICRMNPSRNLFLIGPTGAGKTSIGRRLAQHYGLPFADLDQEIEKHCGVDVATVFEIEGEAGFRQRESALLDECSERQGLVLATGAGAILAEHNRRRLAEQRLRGLAADQHRTAVAAPGARHAPPVARRRRPTATAARHGRIRDPLYRDTADLAVPGEHGGVAAACARCVGLIDQHWQRIAITRPLGTP